MQWTLVRVNTDYQWYKQEGRWTFEQVNSTTKIAAGLIELTKDQPGKIAAQVGLGHYRLDLRGESPKDAQTSVSFDSGWSSESKAPTPDLLDVTLAKDAYASGETLVAKITARADAKATLAIVSDRIHATVLADLKKGENEIKIPVGADWGAGAYALALAHRPLDKAAQRNPGRAIGVAWFAIDAQAHALEVAIKAPPKAQPREKLDRAPRNQGSVSRRRGLCHRGRRRSRHPQSHALPDPRPAQHGSTARNCCRRRCATSTAC